MRLLGNLLWLTIGGGLFTAVQYALLGLLWCITLIGIPFGVQCFKLAAVAIAPFGRDSISMPLSEGWFPIVINAIWLVFGGLVIAVEHFLLALLLALTIIGMPFAAQHLKLATFAVMPFNREIV